MMQRIQQTLLLVMITSCVLAQSPRDTAFVDQAVASGKDLYHASLRSQSHLYNGSQYMDYDPVEDEDPYYLTNDWSTGSVTYNGVAYKDVPMLYDIWNDKLVIEHFAGAFIELIAAKVSHFSFQGRNFQRFLKTQDSRRSISDGFFEVLYEGKTKVVAKRIKRYNEYIETSKIRAEFESKNHYYVVRNNTFYPVNSKKAALQVFGDKKQEMKQFTRSNKTNFRFQDDALVALAKHYDSL
jgi:hypothetical protein